MRITTGFIMFFVIIFLGLSACTKETKIERSLVKKDGIWDVVNVHSISYYNDGSVQSESSVDNDATFIFHKKGKFEWYAFNSSTTLIHEGIWMNTDDELMITRPASMIAGNDAWVFEIVKQSKNEMTLHRISKKADIVSLKNESTYQLKRRN